VTLLRIQGVTKDYGSSQALAGIDLDVEEGEFVSVLGPSGCGKTTLLKIVAGFERVSAGKVFLDGADLLRVPAHRRPVNTVFQRYLLFPHLSVADNVAYGLRFDSTPKRAIPGRVREALRLVRLEALADRRPDELSGGQAQRVSLARALVKQPRLLLLDEPLSALDLAIRVEMQRELRAIHREIGTAFLYVTHDQQEAMSLSDRVVVMEHGSIAQIGTAEDVYHAPQTRYVAQFVGDANLLPYERDSKDRDIAVALHGALRARLDADAPERGVLVARPEAMTLSPCGGTDGIPIVDVAFTGAARLYSLRAGDTIVRVAMTSSLELLRPLSVGDHAYLHIEGVVLALS
jgi:ABC-type Fe3+/spermidine/putrescine transport system ATPase subunit